ncbi:MAG: GNAT family N-acetyltransferase [Clostridia bacterium]|nr:GNAT family N-acetyltransferase [Clostridia bacterium]
MIFTAKAFNELTSTEVYEILKARATVFVKEQKIIYVDMDNVDYSARHFFISENGEVIAYLRAFYEEEGTVHIGRVLTVRRKEGLGKLVMTEAINDIRKNMKCERLRLNSQTHAAGFYEGLGFKRVSNEFLIENIPHYTMELEV